MRIAVDLRTLLTPFESGVSIYTKAMVHAMLQREDCELELFYQAKRPYKRIHEQFINVRHIPISNSIFHLRSLFKFPKLPKNYFKKEPDIIWIPDRRPFYRTKTPLCMTIHDSVPERFAHTSSIKSRLWHYIFNLKRLEKLSDAFIFPSKSVAQEIKPDIQFEVSYEGAHISKTSQKPDQKLLNNYFLCISSSDPRKRIDWIVKAAELNPDLNFIIAGIKKDDPRFPKMNFRKKDNLQWIQEFTELEKKYLLENASCLLALSEYEGFDLPILEALSVNCPVIMSDIPVHRELYSEAIFVKNFEQLQSALQKDLKVPVAKRAYSWEQATESTLLFFHRVITNKN